MVKTLAFVLAFAAVMLTSPNANYQKEIQPIIVTIASADVAPCPEPTVLVAKPIEVKAPQKLKAKKKIIKKESKKKKHAAAHSGHHKHHQKSIPRGATKIPTSHAPPRLTSPPGCG